MRMSVLKTGNPSSRSFGREERLGKAFSDRFWRTGERSSARGTSKFNLNVEGVFLLPMPQSASS